MRECAWCLGTFEPTTQHQIYCGTICRKAATKEKIRQGGRKAVIKKRAKKKRYCANGCGTILSVYNDTKICQKCKINNKLVNTALANIKEYFDYEDKR